MMRMLSMIRWSRRRRRPTIMRYASPLVLVFSVACTDRTASRPGSTADTTANANGTTSAVGGNAVRGLALLTAFRDSLPTHSGNSLRCTSCHLENGTNATALPWLGSAARYPRIRGRSAVMEDLTFRINDCITRSLAGQELARDSQDMRDMLAYLETLRTAERPIDRDTVKLAGHASSGANVYALECARCHGAQGQGDLAPPLWGAESYSIGAGMSRQWTIATFVKNNMPVDRAGLLTDQQAADVAAYVLTQPRQDSPGKELDWPKGNPPGDAAYATEAARALGKPMPPTRPVLPRKVPPRP